MNEDQIEDILEKFLAIVSARDGREIATVLDITPGALMYLIYGMSPSQRYITFEISKKSGEKRTISAPITALKEIQKRLNIILQNIFFCYAKATVHGFVLERNIRTNAQIHAGQRFVLNLDIKDFFPTINFGRVRGLFMKYPFNFSEPVSTVLAQICCYDDQLPQGAPTSPAVSNFICSKMDGEIMQLAKKRRCFYSRYADDLTISTSERSFPKEIAEKSASALRIGNELANIITANGFEINARKTRLACSYQRQTVTSLTVNRFPNPHRKLIKQVRAMFHAWEKYGLDKAEAMYYQKYYSKQRKPKSPLPTFNRVLIGKIRFIEMVRSHKKAVTKKETQSAEITLREDDDPRNKLHQNMIKKYYKLFPRLEVDIRYDKAKAAALIITEGKTDWKYLKAAFSVLKNDPAYSGLDIEFLEYAFTVGDTKLWNALPALSVRNRKRRPVICIFDRDEPSRLKQFNTQQVRTWDNNIFAFAIPAPAHRPADSLLSLELYYTDDELKTRNAQGRRLYLSDEFDLSGQHKNGEGIACTVTDKTKESLCIIDADKAKCPTGASIVLRKNDFAECVLNKENGFHNFDHKEFKKIFDIIKQITVQINQQAGTGI